MTNLYSIVAILIVIIILPIVLIRWNASSTIKPNNLNLPYKYNIFKDQSNFGYVITMNNKIVIKQTHIPAINGVKHFESYKQTEAFASLVVYKLMNKLSPSISKFEVDSIIKIKNDI